MSLQVYWGDRLEELADDMFELLESNPIDDPFQAECLVVGNEVTAAWLKHRFLYDRPDSGRVWANWDIHFIRRFVNDQLVKILPDKNKKREPRFHPYSPEMLSWRIYQLLGKEDFLSRPACHSLRVYLAEKPWELKRFGLARLLARLFDDYQIYRLPSLFSWEKKEGMDWQSELWRELVRENPDSYLKAFLQLDRLLPQTGVGRQYRRINVFGLTGLPPVYLEFFRTLSEVTMVNLYCFNPCRQEWFDDLTDRRRELMVQELKLSGSEPEQEYLDGGNQLLSSWGQAIQEFLSELLDRTDGQIVDRYFDTPPNTLLDHLQSDIRHRVTGPEDRAPVKIGKQDLSLTISICHHPRREVEILRDYLLRDFAQLPDLKPRQIQVLVSDMELYAPYIEAVFSRDMGQNFIPVVLVDRGVASLPSSIRKFLDLLELPTQRFAASKVLSLLSFPPLGQAFGLHPNQVDELKEWVEDSGIRWGWDGKDRQDFLGVDYWENSWRQGLDRMLLGYAFPDGGDDPFLLSDGSLIIPYDRIEGSSCADLGLLIDFVKALRTMIDSLKDPRPLEDWVVVFGDILERFFFPDRDIYPDLALLRGVFEVLLRIARDAGFSEDVPLEVVTAFLCDSLEGPEPSESLLKDSVVFSGARQMRAVPRRVICLLGMNDRDFPRRQNRPGYDLLKKKRLRSDRSLSREDRGAFLEAVMSARDRLHISYLGRAQDDNEQLPPSTVVEELREYLRGNFQLPPDSLTPDGQSLLFCETLHRLQAFSPQYFSASGPLFSYSSTQLEAAQKLLSDKEFIFKPDLSSWRLSSPSAARSELLRLSDLSRFFFNPPAFYLKERLGVSLARVDEDKKADAEPFQLDPRKRVAVQQDMLACLSADVVNDRWRAGGRLPPGNSGKEVMAELEVEIDRFWQSKNPLKEMGGNLGELFSQEPEKVFSRWQGQGLILEGFQKLYQNRGQRCFFHFRPARIKGRDLIQGWLEHLLFAAATGESIPTLIAGRKGKGLPVQWKIIETIAPKQAQKILADLLSWWEKGITFPLPFAPDTSWAYAEKLPNGRDAAELAAQKVWAGDKYAIGENIDPAFFRVFGREGLVRHPEFPALAEAFYQPVFARLLPQKGKKT